MKDSLMDWTYPQFVDANCTLQDPRERQILAAMGVMSESGELGDEWKKHLFHGKELDREKIIHEMGDVLWYMTLMCINEAISFNEIMEANMEKLRLRRIERGEIKQELGEHPIG